MNIPKEQCRPWGYYEIISCTQDYQIKRIVVYPQQQLSYQRHSFRCEHWFIVSNKCQIILDDKVYLLSAGESIDIPVKAWHRLKNISEENVVFIEIQTGTYFGEDDIERMQDDYGRV